MQRFLKTSIFLGFALFLFTRVTQGVITYYINERFVLLTLLAASGFAIVAYVVWEMDRHDGHGHEGHEHHDHDHEHGRLTALGWLIVALPLLLGLLVPPRPLQATAVANREFNLAANAIPSTGQAAASGDMTRWNILDWLNAIQRDGAARFYGQEAQLIGFVYRDDRFADDTFMAARFTLSCCVADASPVGLLVRWEDTAVLPTDQWVEVKGIIEAGSFDGSPIPIIRASQVTPIPQPDQPYLYP